MTSKTITIGLVALAFVAGSITTGTMANAASNAQGQPFKQVDTEIVALELQVDSFFDVFYRDTSNGFDSFFDIFVDQSGARTVDSFFDIFTELHDTDQLTIRNIGSSGEDGVQIELSKGSLQTQIDRLEERIAELEGVSTCEECINNFEEAVRACGTDEVCQREAQNDFAQCVEDLPREEQRICAVRPR